MQIENREEAQRSILQMCRGAFQERVDYEMPHLMENIFDPNTAAKAKRKVTITLELCPDDTRQNIVVNCLVKTTLARPTPLPRCCTPWTSIRWWRWCRRFPARLPLTAANRKHRPA